MLNLLETEPITVTFDDDGARCLYGAIRSTYPDEVNQAHVPCHTARVCCHLVGELPPLILFDMDWLQRLNFQPRFDVQSACQVSRTDNIVKLGYDHIGPISGCKRNGSGPITHRYCYRLHAIRWPDASDIDPHAALGIWVD